MAKIGFLIVMLIFGCCTFMAGIVAPDNIAKPVASFALETYKKWAPKTPLKNDIVEEKIVKPIQYSSLLAVDEKTDVMGVQIGLYSSLTQTSLPQIELTHLKISSQIVDVVMGENIHWSLLVAGPYKTQDELQFTIATLRQRYGYRMGLDVIVWPELKTK